MSCEGEPEASLKGLREVAAVSTKVCTDEILAEQKEEIGSVVRVYDVAVTALLVWVLPAAREKE
jgi:hypothetical protein